MTAYGLKPGLVGIVNNINTFAYGFMVVLKGVYPHKGTFSHRFKILTSIFKFAWGEGGDVEFSANGMNMLASTLI